MKLRAELNDETHDVELTRDGNKVFARIDDRDYELEASEPEPNVFLLKHNAKIYELFVSPQPDTKGRINVTVDTSKYDVMLIDRKKLRGGGVEHSHGDGKAEIKTAMPGKVVRILVAVGDQVKKGDGVIVVEAMKMQNEMKSPKDGRISEIKVTEGDTVAAAEVLVVIE